MIVSVCCLQMEKDSHFNRFAIIQASLVGPAFIITATLIVVCHYTHTHKLPLPLFPSWLFDTPPTNIHTHTHTMFVQIYYAVTMWYIRKVYAFQGM